MINYQGPGKEGQGDNGETMRGQNLDVLRWPWRLASSGAAAAWMVFIFQASSFPPGEINQLLQAFSWLGQSKDVVGHLALYSVLGSLLQISLWSWKSNEAYQLRWTLAAAALATLYGVSDEYHQSFVPGRAASLLDIVVDSAGALTAAVGLKFLAQTWLIGRRTES